MSEKHDVTMRKLKGQLDKNMRFYLKADRNLRDSLFLYLKYTIITDWDGEIGLGGHGVTLNTPTSGAEVDDAEVGKVLYLKNSRLMIDSDYGSYCVDYMSTDMVQYIYDCFCETVRELSEA